MNDDQFADLKQFITATVSQTEARLGERIDGVEARLDKKIESLGNEMHDGFVGVAEAIEEVHTQLEEQEKVNRSFDQRITKLEQRAA